MLLSEYFLIFISQTTSCSQFMFWDMCAAFIFWSCAAYLFNSYNFCIDYVVVGCLWVSHRNSGSFLHGFKMCFAFA